MIKNALISGVMGALISGIMVYFVIPFPETMLANVINNAMSGFISGFMGLLIFLLQNRKKFNNTY